MPRNHVAEYSCDAARDAVAAQGRFTIGATYFRKRPASWNEDWDGEWDAEAAQEVWLGQTLVNPTHEQIFQEFQKFLDETGDFHFFYEGVQILTQHVPEGTDPYICINAGS